MIRSTIDPCIFRAYDIRGVVETQLTAEVVFLIGCAIGSEASRLNEHTLLVAKDGRLSGPTLLQALTEGLLSTGCRVVDVGTVPTPLLYFATHDLQIYSAVMLTASHNPAHYNGLKIILKGETLAADRIRAIYDNIQAGHIFTKSKVLDSHAQQKDPSLIARYQTALLSRVKLARPLKIVIDCAHGVTGLIAPSLFRALGCTVIEKFCDVDGRFPAHSPDPSRVENLRVLIDTVQQEHADIGIAFDGDGDRLGIVSSEGKIIWPDQLLLLFIKSILPQYPGASVVYDVKCTHKIKEYTNRYQGNPIQHRTGHSFIKTKMQESGAILGGEMSGHLYFADRWFGFDDGIYAAARLLELLASSGCARSFFHQLPTTISTPEIQIPCADTEKFAVIQQLQQRAAFPGAAICLIDGIRADYKNGWGLIRASNTSPCLVMRFEADSDQSLQEIQASFRRLINQIHPTLPLPF